MKKSFALSCLLLVFISSLGVASSSMSPCLDQISSDEIETSFSPNSTVRLGDKEYTLECLKAFVPNADATVDSQNFWYNGIDEIFHILWLKEKYGTRPTHVPELEIYIREGYSLTKKALENNVDGFSNEDKQNRLDYLETFTQSINQKFEQDSLTPYALRIFHYQLALLIRDESLPKNEYWTRGDLLPPTDGMSLPRTEKLGDPDITICHFDINLHQQEIRGAGTSPLTRLVPEDYWMPSFVMDNPEFGIFTLVLANANSLGPVAIPTLNDNYPHHARSNAYQFAQHDAGHAQPNELKRVWADLFHKLLTTKLDYQKIYKTVVGLFYNMHENALNFSNSEVDYYDLMAESKTEEEYLQNLLKRRIYGPFGSADLSVDDFTIEVREIDIEDREDREIDSDDRVMSATHKRTSKTTEIRFSSYEEFVKGAALEEKGQYHFLSMCGYPMTSNPYDKNATHETYLTFNLECAEFVNVLTKEFFDMWPNVYDKYLQVRDKAIFEATLKAESDYK